MKKFLSLFLILFASSVSALDSADRSAIDKIVQHFVESWNHHEGRGSADDYTAEADFVNIFGMTFSGKQEIEKRHVQVLQTLLKGSTFETTKVKIREAKEGVAIVQVYWQVTGVQKPGAETMKGVFTHTLVKNDGTWQIESSQNTLIQ